MTPAPGVHGGNTAPARPAPVAERCEAADAHGPRVLGQCAEPATRLVRCSEMRMPVVLSAAGRRSVARDGCLPLCAPHAARTMGLETGAP